ncbi:hypothetical protein KDA82_25090 [Streptomyces daliensis]|uniref:Methyltransferase n=1 Tax=Streptomyces daliensis TaxID=299421 RepID=A0A8T4J3Q4_9ACTN|nr:hypothetical protein [Streptomyces daliensis]
MRPEALSALLRVTAPGGLVLVNTRDSYAESSGFASHVGELANAGRLDLLRHVEDAPYIGTERAQYWALRAR